MITNICKISYTPDQMKDMGNLTVLFVGILIVFLALILLYLVFENIPRLLKVNLRKRSNQENNAIKPLELSGEEGTAIAMAIYFLLNEVHDEESYISTIKRVERRYSPWSSKIYSVRNQFNRL